MDKLVIRGGNPLHGDVRVSGSKNGALPILFASILADEPVVLEDVPTRLVDIYTTTRILSELALDVEVNGEQVRIQAPDHGCTTAPYDLVRRMRASVCALGPLLARRGHARVSLPGGCAIGVRPIDLHLKGLQALGADLKVEHGYVEATAKRMRGTTIFLGGPFGSSVLGTANIMLAATRAEGVTTIESAACEPEIVSLANFLRLLGVEVEGDGTPCVRVHGVGGCPGGLSSGSPGGVNFTMPPDRIEAGTYLIAGALAGGEVTVENFPASQLLVLFDLLEQMEIRFEIGDNKVRVWGHPEPRPVDVTTLPYPGFATDLQAQFMMLLCRAKGISIVTEKVYPDRFMHVPELNRLGARIRKEGPSAIVQGGTRLSGADVMASDLRASASLVLAGLVAEGHTEVHRVYHLDRGYIDMERKLQALGADIRRDQEQSF